MMLHRTPSADHHNTFVVKGCSPRAWSLIIASTAAAVALAACSPKETVKVESPPVVKGDSIQFAPDDASFKSITTVKVAGPSDREITVPGRLVWDEDHTVRIFTPFSGRVEKILADIGAKVVAGQPLAYVQSPDFAAAQSDVRKADAALRVARASLARVKELAANGIVAAKDLQQAEADFASADAESRRANARLQLYGQRGEAMGADQRFTLASPIAGVVVERNLNPGQELRSDQPSSPQFVVTDPSTLWVQLDASEGDLRNFKPGIPVLVSSPQYPDDVFRGEVNRVSDFIDPVSRTLKIRATLRNPDRQLKAEMFVTARVTLPKGEHVSVPEKAVFLDGIRSFVFVKKDERTFVRRPVRAGLAGAGGVPILSGLKEGEDVVTSSSLFLQQIITSDPKADPKSAAKPATGASNLEKGGK